MSNRNNDQFSVFERWNSHCWCSAIFMLWWMICVPGLSILSAIWTLQKILAFMSVNPAECIQSFQTWLSIFQFTEQDRPWGRVESSLQQLFMTLLQFIMSLKWDLSPWDSVFLGFCVSALKITHGSMLGTLFGRNIFVISCLGEVNNYTYTKEKYCLKRIHFCSNVLKLI